jgi:hypothetical protein
MDNNDGDRFYYGTTDDNYCRIHDLYDCWYNHDDQLRIDNNDARFIGRLLVRLGNMRSSHCRVG